MKTTFGKFLFVRDIANLFRCKWALKLIFRQVAPQTILYACHVILFSGHFVHASFSRGGSCRYFLNADKETPNSTVMFEIHQPTFLNRCYVCLLVSNIWLESFCIKLYRWLASRCSSPVSDIRDTERQLDEQQDDLPVVGERDLFTWLPD